MQGILEKLFATAQANPQRIVYDFLDCQKEPFLHDRITMGELYDRSADIACELKRQGAKAGDRAIIFSMQDKGTVYAIFGCMLAGVIFTVLPPPMDQSKTDRFISVLKSCKAKYLISNAALEATSENGANTKKQLVKQAFFAAISLKRIYTDKIPPRKKGETPFHTFAPDDLIYLQYTSGSTAAPKGVMVSYGNVVKCTEMLNDIFPILDSDKYNLASWVPFYHNIGLLVSIFMPILTNSGIAYMIPTLQFLSKPTIWMKVMSDYKINVTAAPNSAYDSISRLVSPKKAEEYDLKHVELLINGSEFINARTIDQFCSRFGLSRNAFVPGYGLSECVCVATLSYQDYHKISIDRNAYQEGKFIPVADGAEGSKEIVSVGKPALDTQIVILRPDGTPAAADEIGEVAISGSILCQGYWQNPEESARFHYQIPGYEGEFYRTGDMGILYDGQLYLTGRAKEMIIMSGKNIFPGDITLALSEHGLGSSLEAVGVFSIQGDNGEQPILCAEAVEGSNFKVLAAQINRVIAKGFGFSFHDVVFVNRGTLPRTDNRKLKTLEIRRLYQKGMLSVLFSTIGTNKNSAKAEEQDQTAITAQSSDSDLRNLVRKAFQKQLPVDQFSDDDNFLEMGGDSLRLMELVCDIEQRLGKETDLREIAVNPTISGIADYLGKFLRGEIKEHKVDLPAECVLDEAIRPVSAYNQKPEECTKIFLTGATGFLGAYLVRAILNRKPDAVVYCHARAISPEKAMDRIRNNMKNYHTWDDAFETRILPICGDLSKPHLGMSDEDWAMAAKETELVIHNGAILNFVFPYERMKPVNVTGTAEAIRFACEGRAKYFHYVSSYSAYDNPSHFGRESLEDDPLHSSEGYFLGYSETKWVAEHLVQIARERGVKASIYRPGDITGTLETGIWKLEDLVSRSLVGSIQMGSAPDTDIKLHLTPVDFVAEAIVAIAFQSASINHGFNLLNHHLMSIRDITKVMQELGYDVKLLDYGEWCEQLVESPTDNVLRILSCLFTADGAMGVGLLERYSCDQPLYSTKNADTLLSGTGVSCPPVNRDLIYSYLKHFADDGYIPQPKA